MRFICSVIPILLQGVDKQKVFTKMVKKLSCDLLFVNPYNNVGMTEQKNICLKSFKTSVYLQKK